MRNRRQALAETEFASLKTQTVISSPTSLRFSRKTSASRQRSRSIVVEQLFKTALRPSTSKTRTATTKLTYVRCLLQAGP
jgi:hypothetical protein